MPWISSVALTHTSDDCLRWPFCLRGGRRKKDAYPALGGRGYAHVLLCELVNGARPSPQHEAEHLCGNKLCMNPRHVQWALHKQNCARRTQHGTQTVGVRHGMALLSEADVLAIRATPKRTRGLSAKYGVSNATICVIRAGRTWKHI